MNLELKARITEADLGTYDINGFKFNLHKMEVGSLKDFKVLLPIFNDVFEGDCFVTTNWALTRLPGSDDPYDLCVRVVDMESVSKEDFEPSSYLKVRVAGMYLNSDKCFLRTIGVTRKPFYMATLKIKDDTGSAFPIPLVGFRNQAKKLSTIKKQSIIEVEATVKARRDGKGFELALIHADVVHEQ